MADIHDIRDIAVGYGWDVSRASYELPRGRIELDLYHVTRDKIEHRATILAWSVEELHERMKALNHEFSLHFKPFLTSA